MIPRRRVPRLVRAILALAALLVAGVGPAAALASAWRAPYAASHVAAKAHATPAHRVAGIASTHRRTTPPLGAVLPHAAPGAIAASVVGVLDAVVAPANATPLESEQRAHPTRAPPTALPVG